MFIYAFDNYTFNYDENLILRISPLLIIGLSEACYESSILFHWMQWPLNLISRPVDVCFALQCSSSFINWRSKTLRILITPWYALLQFPCVRFPFVRTYWQILTLEHRSSCPGAQAREYLCWHWRMGSGDRRSRLPTPDAGAASIPRHSLSPWLQLLSATATATRRHWSGPGPRPLGSQATQKIHVCVCLAIGPTARCQAPGLSLLLICLFPSSPRTCLQNASVKMKLSKLSWWQPQSINHTQ